MTLLRPDLALIAEHVASGSRVLDVGCGDGALMAALRDQCGTDARGLELDPEDVAAAMARGCPWFRGTPIRTLAIIRTIVSIMRSSARPRRPPSGPIWSSGTSFALDGRHL